MAREYLIDSAYGVQTYLHYDNHTNESHIETVHDQSKVIDHVKRIERESYDGMSADRSFQYIGELTPVVIMEWLKKGFDVFKATPQELMKWIERNKQEYGYLFIDRSKPHAGIIIKGSR